MQLELFNLSGEKQDNYSEIQWIDINKLKPHPDNPRMIIKDDVISSIKESIKKEGFQPCYALLVRPFKDEYQIISGHTRFKASLDVGVKLLPCWIKNFDDEQAYFELVKANSQGELSPLEIGIHALKYVELSEGGRGKKGGLSGYAREIGKAQPHISNYTSAAKVIHHCIGLEVNSFLDKANHLSHIFKTPQDYWQQLTELLIENEWSVKQTEEISRAVREIEIPEHFQSWLNPDKYIKKTIREALTGNIRTPRDINNWVSTAQEYYDSFDTQSKVMLVQDNKELIEYWNLQELFLNELVTTTQGSKAPSKQKIEKIALSIRERIDELEQQYNNWLTSKASEDELKKQQAKQQKEILLKKQKYSPVGYNDCLLNVLPKLELKFDAIITDPPYLLSNDGTTNRSGKEVSVNKNFADNLDTAIHPEKYLQLFYDCLKDGGYFVFTCTHHLRDIIRPIADNYGFEFIQDLIWLKPNSPPLLTADRFKPSFEYISVYKKPGQSYFGYEEIKGSNDSQANNVVTINQCSGNERLGWHNTQKPIELMELLIKAYCPQDGLVLEPFAGTATTAAACKQLNRICHWIEQKDDFYSMAQSRIDEHKFSWEV